MKKKDVFISVDLGLSLKKEVYNIRRERIERTDRIRTTVNDK